MTATTPPPLPADLTEGLKRLKMAAMRRLAPELLVTAKTQRWKPEEFLRTLVEAEIAARDASNARTRLKQAAFPVTKTLEQFDVAASSIPKATFDYLELPGVGAGGGERVPDRPRRHRQVPHARRARDRRRRGRAPGPVLHRRGPRRDPLPRPGRQLRRDASSTRCCATTWSSSTNWASHHWTTPARSCCSGSSQPPTNADPSASGRTGPSSPGDGSCPNTPPPSACSTGSCELNRPGFSGGSVFPRRLSRSLVLTVVGLLRLQLGERRKRRSTRPGENGTDGSG